MPAALILSGAILSSCPLRPELSQLANDATKTQAYVSMVDACKHLYGKCQMLCMHRKMTKSQDTVSFKHIPSSSDHFVQDFGVLPLQAGYVCPRLPSTSKGSSSRYIMMFS